MGDLIVKVLGSCALLFGTLCWVKATRDYLMSNYPYLIWTTLIMLIATFLGVLFAFIADNYRQEKVERDIFRYKLVALLFESGENIKNIKSIREDFTPTRICTTKLKTDIAKQVIADPLTFKHGHKGLIYVLIWVIESIEDFNRNSDFAINQFYQNKTNAEINLVFISASLDYVKYRTEVLQKVLDHYNVEKFNTTFSKEPIYDEIWKLIKEEPNFEDKLNKMREKAPDGPNKS